MKRTQGTGIYKRGTLYWLNIQIKGKRQFIALETSDYTEAITRANEIRANPDLTAGQPFEEEIRAFIAHKRRQNEFTAASASSRQYVLTAFGKRVGLAPAQVRTEDVKAYYENALDTQCISTANTYLGHLHSFFQWTTKTAHITRRNPCDGIVKAREHGTKAKDFCTFEQRNKLISECEREDMKFVLFCGFHAGLRKNEIIEATPQWFDLDAGLLRLRKTPTMAFKDREERTVPLTSEFIAFLKGYGLRAPFMLAPTVTHGKNRYRYDFIRNFRTYVAAQGMPWVTPHIMRHTFASLLASRGVSLFKIAKWLGDDPRVVESRYAKIIPNDPDIERAHTS